MQKIIGVKRSNDKNLYYFLCNETLGVGEQVVVSFDEFQTIATIVDEDVKFSEDKISELKKIVRVASSADKKRFAELQDKARLNLKSIKAKSLELGLMMKFVSAEYSLDNSKIIITFSSEERVDFRQFLKDLASMLKTRIELKQIGQRDEVKVFGGVGPCGEPCCCARFLKEFEHVTVKMAKIQGLSLSPTKINGICGRLMCCLGYESSTYEEVLSRMPKINSEIVTPNGKGIAVYNDILRERVSVKRQADGDTFVVEDYALDEIGFEGHPIKQVKSQSQSNSKQKDEEIKKYDSEKNEKTNNKKDVLKKKNAEEGVVSKDENLQNTDKMQTESDSKRKHNHFKHKNKNKQKSYNNKNQ